MRCPFGRVGCARGTSPHLRAALAHPSLPWSGDAIGRFAPVGIRRHLQIAPWTDYVEVHWAPGAEPYVTPVADDCVGIAILTSRRGGFDSHLKEFAALKDRVHGHPHGPDMAAGPLRQKVPAECRGGCYRLVTRRAMSTR